MLCAANGFSTGGSNDKYSIKDSWEESLLLQDYCILDDHSACTWGIGHVLGVSGLFPLTSWHRNGPTFDPLPFNCQEKSQLKILSFSILLTSWDLKLNLKIFSECVSFCTNWFYLSWRSIWVPSIVSFKYISDKHNFMF